VGASLLKLETLSSSVLEEEAFRLAKLRGYLASHSGEYVEAAREAEKLLLVVENFLVYAAFTEYRVASKAASLVASKARVLHGLKDDPPRLLGEAYKIARIAALAQAYVEASLKVYLFVLSVAVILASIVFATAFLYTPLSIWAVAMLSTALGLLIGATLLASKSYSILLTAISLVVYLFILGASIPTIAETLIIITGFTASELLRHKGLVKIEKVAAFEAG
jgi:hypothetical protein